MSGQIPAVNGRRTSDWFTGFIRDLGFPILVACYLLFSLGPKMDALVTEIKTLRVEMTSFLSQKIK